MTSLEITSLVGRVRISGCAKSAMAGISQNGLEVQIMRNRLEQLLAELKAINAWDRGYAGETPTMRIWTGPAGSATHKARRN